MQVICIRWCRFVIDQIDDLRKPLTGEVSDVVEPDNRTPLYGIAVAAQLVDMPEATLRLFERRGLLSPSRSEGGTRRYSEGDIERLRRVGRLRDEGMNLAGIGRLIELEDENAGLRVELAAERGESES
jgi:MerR family transcriptional regulator/heat shock protein HspR